MSSPTDQARRKPLGLLSVFIPASIDRLFDFVRQSRRGRGRVFTAGQSRREFDRPVAASTIQVVSVSLPLPPAS